MFFYTLKSVDKWNVLWYTLIINNFWKEEIKISDIFVSSESERLVQLEIENVDKQIYARTAIPNTDKKLIIKKYLGHKPIEVFAGVLTGIAMAFILRMFY